MDMLIHQKVQINTPTIYTFLCRYVRAGFANIDVVQMSCYIADKCLACYEMLKQYPSLIAATCVYIARKSYMTSVLQASSSGMSMTTQDQGHGEGDVRHLITPPSSSLALGYTPFFTSVSSSGSSSGFGSGTDAGSHSVNGSVWSPLSKSTSKSKSKPQSEYISPPYLSIPSPRQYSGMTTTAMSSNYSNSNTNTNTNYSTSNSNTNSNLKHNTSPLSNDSNTTTTITHTHPLILTNLWSATLKHCTGYTLDEVEDCALYIHAHCFSNSTNGNNSNTTSTNGHTPQSEFKSNSNHNHNPHYTPSTSTGAGIVKGRHNDTPIKNNQFYQEQLYHTINSNNCNTSSSINTMSEDPFLIINSSCPQPDYANPNIEFNSNGRNQNMGLVDQYQCSYEAVNRKYCTDFSETTLTFGNIQLKF